MALVENTEKISVIVIVLSSLGLQPRINVRAELLILVLTLARMMYQSCYLSSPLLQFCHNSTLKKTAKGMEQKAKTITLI